MPAGESPVLYVSPHACSPPALPSAAASRSPFHGFASHPTDPSKPAHGFARTTHMAGHRGNAPGDHRRRRVVLRLEADDEQARAVGLNVHRIAGRSLGATLAMTARSENVGHEALGSRLALHTYLARGRRRSGEASWSRGRRFVDKVDGGKDKVAAVSRRGSRRNGSAVFSRHDGDVRRRRSHAGAATWRRKAGFLNATVL